MPWLLEHPHAAARGVGDLIDSVLCGAMPMPVAAA
jgi:hypothetical protein